MCSRTCQAQSLPGVPLEVPFSAAQPAGACAAEHASRASACPLPWSSQAGAAVWHLHCSSLHCAACIRDHQHLLLLWHCG